MKTTYNATFEAIGKTITNINSFVEDNGYKLTGTYTQISEEQFKAAYSNLSRKSQKKLDAFMWRINNYPTIRKINNFIHFLKKVTGLDLGIKVEKSSYELSIENKRKAYKEALAVVKAAYTDYKETKGDFYKQRLAKSVKV